MHDLWQAVSTATDAAEVVASCEDRLYARSAHPAAPVDAEGSWRLSIRHLHPAAPIHLRDLRPLQTSAPEVRLPVTVAAADASPTVPRAPHSALVDSGATVSCMSQTVAAALGLVPTIAPGRPTRLRMASGSVHRLGSVEAQLSANGVLGLVTLEVLADCDAPIILGLDLMAAFRIGISMPAPVRQAGELMVVVDGTSAEGPPADLGGPALVSDEHRCSPEIVALVEAGIAQGLAAQSQLDPAVACSHPSAKLALQLIEGARPAFTRQYRIPQASAPHVDKDVAVWDATRVCSPTSRANPWNNSVVAVPKRNLLGEKTDVRTCLDFRKLNSLTHDIESPIPLVQDLFDRCQGFTIASAFDLTAGYTQIRLSDGTSEMTAFRWRGQARVFRRAPFGLKQMTGFFQRLMEEIAEEAGILDRCIIYVDDIVVLSTSVSQHIADCSSLIATMSKYHLRLNLQKCHFAYQRLRILGFLLSGSDKRVDSRKAQEVLDFPRPTSTKQLQSFLGLVNFLRDHCPHLATLASPLEELRHAKRFSPALWTQRRIKAFTSVRQLLQEAPALHLPRPDTPFVVGVDASLHGLGAALWQVVDGVRHYIVFASKSLSGAQRNYSANKRELLGVLFAFRRFRHYLQGRRFELQSDHQSLTWLLRTHSGKSVIEDWLAEVVSMSFDFVHVPGRQNIIPDYLSRLYPAYYWEAGVGKVRTRQRVAVAASAPLEAPMVLNDQPVQADRHLASMVREVHGKVCPPEPDRAAIIDLEHRAGHTGGSKLFQQLFLKGYFWPGMRKQCLLAVSHCRTCVQQNVAREGFLPAKSTVAQLPWSTIAVDLMSLEKSAAGHVAALVVVDVATRFVVLRPLPDKTAASVSTALLDICGHFLMPEVVISDNGPEFAANLTQSLADSLGVQWRFIAAYNPRGNGLVERMVGVSKNALRKLIHGDRAHWERKLGQVMLALNTRVSPRTLSTPCALMLGRECRAVAAPAVDLLSPGSEALDSLGEGADVLVAGMLARWRDMHAVVYPAVAAAAERRADASSSALDRRRGARVGAPFAPGSLVMMRQVSPDGTLDDRYDGPVQVLRQVGHSYECATEQGDPIPGLITHSRLKRATHVDEANWGAAPADNPAESSGASFTVERLLASRMRQGLQQYKVRWKGYGPVDDSWEPADHISNHLIDTFIREQNGMKRTRRQRRRRRA